MIAAHAWTIVKGEAKRARGTSRRETAIIRAVRSSTSVAAESQPEVSGKARWYDLSDAPTSMTSSEAMGGWTGGSVGSVFIVRVAQSGDEQRGAELTKMSLK